METQRKRILFVCTGNAGRSQMAEAAMRELTDREFDIRSAGVDPWDRLHSMPVQLMKERGIDMSRQQPKHVSTFDEEPFDLVITMGGPALELTPEMSGNPRRIHWDIDDPADFDGTPEEREAFERALAQIDARLPEVLILLRKTASASELHLQPGIATCVFGDLDPAKHLKLAADAGVKVLELAFWRGSLRYPWDNWDKMNELKTVIDDLGLKVFSVHSMKDVCPPQDIKHQKLAVDLMKVFADLAVEMGAQVVVVHGSMPKDLPRDDAKKILFDGLKELEAHVLSMPCMFSWENNVPPLTAAEHIEMLRQLNPSAFGFTLDNGHSYIHKDTDEYIALAGKRICSLHIQDNDGVGDEHKIPGEGTFQWEGFVGKLLDAGYVGPLTLETNEPTPARDMSKFMRESVAAVERLKELSGIASD